jgi:hypothetical protein
LNPGRRFGKLATTPLTYGTAYNNNNNNNNNSIQFLIINVPSQQLQRQLQTQHGVDIGNF